MNIYEVRPEVKNERFLLRLAGEQDCEDLLKVYSDGKAVLRPNYVGIIFQLIIGDVYGKLMKICTAGIAAGQCIEWNVA